MYVHLHLQKKVLLAMYYMYSTLTTNRSHCTLNVYNKPQVYLSLVASYLSNIVVWVREFEYLATKTTNYE